MDLDKFKTSINKQYTCYFPFPRPKPLVAFDIVDKLKDYESEIACEVLEQLITHIEEVQDFLVENYIDILQEEEPWSISMELTIATLS